MPDYHHIKRHALPALFASACMLLSAEANACSTCMVGDPTQSLMGAEKPYENRLRISLDMLARSEELGEPGFNRKTIDEQRISFNIAYAPSTKWMLSLSIPYINRRLDAFNFSSQEVTALGDISITIKNFLQDKKFMQTHMYGLLAGIKLPTGSEQTDTNNTPLDFDVQAGQGATVVNAGIWYGNFNYPYMFYTSAAAHIANEGFQRFQAGDALTLNASAQYATSDVLAFNLAIEGRWSKRDQYSDIKDENSGGAIVFMSSGLIYTIKQDLLFTASVKFPAVVALNGSHDEGIIATLGVTYDFEMH